MNLRNGKHFDGRELIYSFHVIEYQYRGLPHAHFVARLKDAPDISGQNNEDLIITTHAYKETFSVDKI